MSSIFEQTQQPGLRLLYMLMQMDRMNAKFDSFPTNSHAQNIVWRELELYMRHVALYVRENIFLFSRDFKYEEMLHVFSDEIAGQLYGEVEARGLGSFASHLVYMARWNSNIACLMMEDIFGMGSSASISKRDDISRFKRMEVFWVESGQKMFAPVVKYATEAYRSIDESAYNAQNQYEYPPCVIKNMDAHLKFAACVVARSIPEEANSGQLDYLDPIQLLSRSYFDTLMSIRSWLQNEWVNEDSPLDMRVANSASSYLWEDVCGVLSIVMEWPEEAVKNMALDNRQMGERVLQIERAEVEEMRLSSRHATSSHLISHEYLHNAPRKTNSRARKSCQCIIL